MKYDGALLCTSPPFLCPPFKVGTFFLPLLHHFAPALLLLSFSPAHLITCAPYPLLTPFPAYPISCSPHLLLTSSPILLIPCSPHILFSLNPVILNSSSSLALLYLSSHFSWFHDLLLSSYIISCSPSSPSDTFVLTCFCSQYLLQICMYLDPMYQNISLSYIN